MTFFNRKWALSAYMGHHLTDVSLKGSLEEFGRAPRAHLSFPKLPIVSRYQGMQATAPCFYHLERFSNECRKTKTKVITPANHNKNKLPNEPIRTRSKYM